METVYDLHIHSCLSPCGDNTMTPDTIAGIAALNGLNLFALTDHNTTRNCVAAWEAAKNYGVGFVPGMELTTSEDIHVVCLFSGLEQAMEFDAYVWSKLPMVKNRPDIFGEQLVCDVQGNVIDQLEKLLINATEISVSQVEELMHRFGGMAFPAHVDKDANSLFAILGGIPQECHFPVLEVANLEKLKTTEWMNREAEGKLIVQNSDAHYPWDISQGANRLMGECRDFHTLKKQLGL